MSYYAEKKGIRKILKLDKVVKNLLINMFVSFFGLHIMFNLPLCIFDEYNSILKIMICILTSEVWFYHTHIMLHQQKLYVLFHKKHHEFTEPYALTGIYCSLYELIFCNIPTIALGPILTNMNPILMYIWVFVVSLNVTFTHSGIGKEYDLNDHDIHHSSFKYNYGTLYIFDALYGTLKSQY